MQRGTRFRRCSAGDKEFAIQICAAFDPLSLHRVEEKKIFDSTRFSKNEKPEQARVSILASWLRHVYESYLLFLQCQVLLERKSKNAEPDIQSCNHTSTFLC